MNVNVSLFVYLPIRLHFRSSGKSLFAKYTSFGSSSHSFDYWVVHLRILNHRVSEMKRAELVHVIHGKYRNIRNLISLPQSNPDSPFGDSFSFHIVNSRYPLYPFFLSFATGRTASLSPTVNEVCIINACITLNIDYCIQSVRRFFGIFFLSGFDTIESSLSASLNGKYLSVFVDRRNFCRNVSISIVEFCPSVGVTPARRAREVGA